MPYSQEIAVWVDADKYEALAEQLEEQGKSIEQAVAESIEKMYRDIVPIDKRCEITKRAEEAQRQQEKEEAEQRRYALFKITKNGQVSTFEDEFYTGSFSVAFLLRRFLRGENDIGDNFFNGTPKQENHFRSNITLESFNENASMYKSIDQVLRVFDIDLDHGYISIGDKVRGCSSYSIKDVTTAAYYAGKAQHSRPEWRENEFYRRLDGKAICMDQAIKIS